VDETAPLTSFALPPCEDAHALVTTTDARAVTHLIRFMLQLLLSPARSSAPRSRAPEITGAAHRRYLAVRATASRARDQLTTTSTPSITFR